MTKLPDPPDDLMQSLPGFLIVGLGASAGGIEALREFFTQVPSDSGIAYVVILHLSPEHESQLANVLQTVTSLPVIQVTETVRAEPNHVYVVSPNQHLTMVDSDLTVSPHTLMEERHAPVDIFFRTLAETHHTRAVCVVLSGTGADGSMGLKRVKERGGVVFVQSPREAAFNEMPRSAIATNLADDVLPVADIPARIMAYQASLSAITIPVEADQRPQEQQQALREIFTQLRVRTGHDFSNYKRPTLLRRIARRISVRNLPDLPAYAAFVREDPDEVQALLKDLLISVTNFFRDKEAFATLEQEIIPRLFQGKRADEQVRIWVAGCATGEEAYSIAMLCAERVLGVFDAPSVQIFASDIGEAAIAHAREGLYTASDTADVPPEQLRRFFTLDDQRYRIRREIREMVLFANHNVLKDPPFSHVDLVTCRNMLIYLNHTAQERVMETLHFALKPGGYLFLGTSESIDGSNDLFSTLSREQHIFQSRATGTRPLPVVDAVPSGRAHPARLTLPVPEPDERAHERLNYGDLHLRLLEQYAPPSVVINEAYDVVHLSGRAGRYLQLADGLLSHNLLDLALPEVRLHLRSALNQAIQRQTNVETGPLPIHIDKRAEMVTIHVRPVLHQDDPAHGFLLVLFEQSAAAPNGTEPVVQAGEPLARQLEGEVQRLKQQLRSSSEQYEYQAEELKATNEELQALNQELRSSAEELEASKEELQALNEELRTVNQELKAKVEEATLHSTNLQNLVNSTDIGTIFLDRSLRVKLFTPAARELFNLIQADYGRPLADITHRLLDADVLADAETVLGKLRTIEREVRTNNGRVYLLRVLPYRAGEDRIGGVVITFEEITERKRRETNLTLLAEISAEFAPRLSADELMRRVGERLAKHLGLSRCDFSEVDAETDRITTLYDWRRNSAAPSALGEHQISTFLSEAGLRRYVAGELTAVDDAWNSPLMSAPRELLEQLDIGAVIDAPYLENGRWKFLLSACRAQPTIWREDEIELIHELAARIYIRLERARAETALRESEEKFRLLVEGARDYAMFLLDPAAQITFWSSGAERVFGWSQDEAVGQAGALIFTPEDRDRGAVERELRTAIDTGRAEDRRWHIRKDTSRLFVDGMLVRLDDPAGQLRGFVKIARDATAQHQAEEALQRAHDQLENRVEERTSELAAANRLLEQEIEERRQLAAQRAVLLERILTEQETERQRISRELHDTLGQFLSALNMRLTMARSLGGVPSQVSEEFAQLLALSGQIDREVDRLTTELHPRALEDFGLADALRSHAEQWSATSKVPVDMMVIGLDSSRLRPAIETTVYRIVQEALTNVLKHAQASAVSVVVERQPGALRVIVEDNGVGFVASAVAAPSAGGRQVGLVGMSERAALVEGELTIEAAPGAGTTIYLHIPLGDDPTEGTGNAHERDSSAAG